MAAVLSNDVNQSSPVFKHVESAIPLANATFDTKTHMSFALPAEFYTLEQLGLASSLAAGRIQPSGLGRNS